MNHPPEMAFRGAALDLAEHKRTAEDLQKFLNRPDAQALIMYHGRFLVRDERLVTVKPSDIKGKNLYDPGPLFLGLDGKTPVFAFSFADEYAAADLVKGAHLDHLRNLAFLLPARDLALAGRAKSLFDWHRSHRFCSNCGVESKSANGGVTRHCNSCGTDHFPRVNPVAIMLVIRGEKCLLGRAPNWPEHAYSALAGFVSPGESLEEACQREVLEEVGIRVGTPVFKFSQPWPWPSQLMMGLFCTAQSSKIKLDKTELSDARWFTKDQVRAGFARQGHDFIPPPPFTIAHHLLKAWLEDV